MDGPLPSVSQLRSSLLFFNSAFGQLFKNKVFVWPVSWSEIDLSQLSCASYILLAVAGLVTVLGAIPLLKWAKAKIDEIVCGFIFKSAPWPKYADSFEVVYVLFTE